MAKSKQKFNIAKIGVKNIFLLFLLMGITTIGSVIIKAFPRVMKGKIAKTGIVNAQSCWSQTDTYSPASCESCSGCDGGGDGCGAGSY